VIFQNDLSKKEYRLMLSLFYIPPITFALVVAVAFFLTSCGKPITIDKLGQFGDLIGGVLNPVVAYLGLVGIFIALLHENRRRENGIDEAREDKKQHTQQLQQANAIGLLQAFTNACYQARIDKQPDQSIRRSILQNYAVDNGQYIQGPLSLANLKWGGVARSLSLMNSVTQETPYGRSVVETAISLLNTDELELVLICLIQANPKLAEEVCSSEKVRLTADLSSVLLSIKCRQIPTKPMESKNV
jgi:hypothetical protein